MSDLIARAMAAQNARKTGPFAYNTENALLKWRMAKARLDSGIKEVINLNIIGDSISEGTSDLSATVDNYEKAWVSTLRQKIIAKYGDVGEGFIPNRYPVIAAVGKWTYTGTWTNAGIGWCNTTSAAKKTTVIGATASLNFNGTGIVLLARKFYSGKVNVVVDGGAAQVWNTFGEPSGLSTFTVSGLTNGAHTVVLTTIDSAPAANGIELFGAYEIKGDSGIRVNRLACSGNQIHTINQYDETLVTCIDYWTPKLTIISMIANNYNTQAPLDEYENDFRVTIQRAKLFGDVLITSLGAAHTAVKTIPVSVYKDICFKLAIENNVAFLDLAMRWGGSDQAAASGYLTDGVHPTIPGHYDVVNAIAEVVL